MRVVVFGAGGRVGQRVVEYALQAGHEVRAVLRGGRDVPFVMTAMLHVDRGDVLEPLMAQTALRGADVAVSAIGGRSGDALTTLRTDATRQILDGMNVHGVPRCVLVSDAHVLTDEPLLREARAAEPGLEPVVADHRGAFELVRKSGVDFLLACPPRMLPGTRSGRYRREIEGLPEGGREISPEDVADFIVGALGGDQYRRVRVGLAY